MGTKNIRTAPFGQPPSGGKGHENEVLNPGRYQYGSKSSMGYYSTVFDPWTLIWVDELFKQTPEVLNNNSFELPEDYPTPPSPLVDEEPDYDTGWALNRKNTWQSGPPKNVTVTDNAVPGAGYWTKNGGPNATSTKKEPGYEIYTSNSRPVQLFNMGHANVASQGGSAETNVIGWDGYFSYDAQGFISSTTECNIGVPHAYAMYTVDMSIDAMKELVAKLEEWVENNKDPDEDGSGTFAYLSRALFPGPQVRTPSIKLIIRIIKMIKKIITQANSDGVVGGLLVNWDFICGLTVPTDANEYLFPADGYGNPGTGGSYGHGNGGPHGPERFSYLITEECQAFTQIMSMRANGVLWHITADGGGARARLLRTFNFAHIHSMTMTDRLDHRLRDKYRQVLSFWGSNVEPDSILDKTRRLDNRG